MPDDLSAPRPLVLPPPYTAHWLARGDAFTTACDMAALEGAEHGAGTLVWHAQAGGGVAAGKLDFAVVLEPDMPLAQARRAFIPAMLALGDALAAHCAPERSVRFGWPGEVFLDAGRLGGMRLHIAPDVTEKDVPDWMVLGVELIADRDNLSDPGDRPASVSLVEEDFADPPVLVESFAAHLMLYFDRLIHGGFEALAADYSSRLTTHGTLTDAGDLKNDRGIDMLTTALATHPWRDAQGPKL